jgi:hypothetical protein
MPPEGTMLKMAVVLIVANTILSGCGSTRYESTWSDPSASPVTLSGQKVAAFFFGSSETARREAEDVLARELTARGAEGIPGYTLLPGSEHVDPLAVRQRLQQAGVEGAVTMRVIGREKQTTHVPPTIQPTFGGYWGGMYRGGYYSPGYTQTDTFVSVETRAFSLRQDRLLWSGQSVTTNPSKVESLVKELSAQAAEEMQKSGVLKKP